jgi:hypothetical protein
LGEAELREHGWLMSGTRSEAIGPAFKSPSVRPWVESAEPGPAESAPFPEPFRLAMSGVGRAGPNTDVRLRSERLLTGSAKLYSGEPP